MANKYRVLMVQGPYPLVRGFIAGFLTGRGLGGKVFYCEKEKIHFDIGEDDGLADRLKEWIGFHKLMATPLVIEEKIHGPVVEAFHGSRHDIALTVKVDQPIKSASFVVRFTVYNREIGAKVHEVVKNPPEGITLSDDFLIEEIVHKNAKGVEGYAPEHDYELKGEGTIKGDLETVIDFRNRVKVADLVHCDPIELEIG